MSKQQHKKQTRKRNLEIHHGVLWISVAAVLAVLSAGLILWVVRQPAVPTVAIVSPVTYSQGDQTYQPGTTRKYVIVELEVKNPTALPFNFAPVVQTYLTDSKGYKYEMAPAELPNPIEAGPIAPGETIRGQLSYNVPSDVTVLEFHFVTDDHYHISFAQRL
jgi:hypothetical protein